MSTLPAATVPDPRIVEPSSTWTVPPATGPALVETVTRTTGRWYRTTVVGVSTVASVVLGSGSCGSTELGVAGIVTVVPLGCAVNTYDEPPGTVAGAVKATVAETKL